MKQLKPLATSKISTALSAARRAPIRAYTALCGLAAFTLLAPMALRAQDLAEVPVRTAPSIEVLRKEFLTPPDAAKPMVRWWWFGPAVVKPEILRELTQMKADGLGGAELAFVYAEELDDPAKGIKNLTFLSPEMLDDVKYAQEEGRKLGLRIDITLCSGWPYGGPATTLAEAVTRLQAREVPVPAGMTSIAVPALGEGETVISAAIADPSNAPAPAPTGGRGGRNGGPRAASFDAATAKPLTVSGSTATVTASDKPRVALFFVQGHTKQQVKRASVGAEGWVLDSFSKEAVATHLKEVGEPLIKAFGATPPYAIFSDSLEAFGGDWTPNLPAEFKKRRGYDLLPHLPELVAGGSVAADTVRHDYGVTLTELVNENYLKQITDWATAHHTKFRSQTYHESAVNFSSQNITQLAEGEGPQWRAFSTLRWASSANHVFGHDVTSGETFTWLHSPVFRAVPLDMKVEADIDFIMGENQIVMHGWPYSPPQAFYPGWSLYAAANFNDNNPWHPVMPSVDRYITRLSYLMRQGQPANQVAILVPTDDAWASFHLSATSITNEMPRLIPSGLMSAILSAGYNVDYIDAEAINKVGLGTHQILILPPTDRIPVATLQKIAAWTKTGGKVIAVGHAPTMDPEGKSIGSFSSAVPASILVADETAVADALHNAAAPDFKLADPSFAMKDQLGFIRRKLSYADVYFVANTANTPMDFTASFASKFSSGTAVDPDSGVSIPANAVGEVVHLAPYESRIFFFDSSNRVVGGGMSGMASTPIDLSSDWKVTFTSLDKTVNESTPTDWLADPSTKNYSGEAVYAKDFNLASAPTGATYLEVAGGKPTPGAPNTPPPPDARALGPDGLPNPLITRPEPRNFGYYDAPIREAALVTINGQPAGALWHPPYRLDVSKLLKTGANHIEIRIYNTDMNQWAAMPPHDFGPLTAKYGDKFQMQDLQRVAPVSSGLLGPVHLVTETK